jgi:hypothetical protein
MYTICFCKNGNVVYKKVTKYRLRTFKKYINEIIKQYHFSFVKGDDIKISVDVNKFICGNVIFSYRGRTCVTSIFNITDSNKEWFHDVIDNSVLNMREVIKLNVCHLLNELDNIEKESVRTPIPVIDKLNFKAYE